MKIKPAWLEWAKEILRPIKHNALLCMPIRELCYRLDREQSKLFLVYEGPGYDRVYKALNEEVFKAVGFPIVDGVRLTKEELQTELDKCSEIVIDRPSLVRGMLEKQHGKRPQ